MLEEDNTIVRVKARRQKGLKETNQGLIQAA